MPDPEQLDSTHHSDLTSQMKDITLVRRATYDSQRAGLGARAHSFKTEAGSILQYPLQPTDTDWRSIEMNSNAVDGSWARPSAQLLIPYPSGFDPGVPISHAASDYAASTCPDSPLTTSFASEQSSQDTIWNPYGTHQVPSTFAGKMDFTTQQSGNRHNAMQVYHTMVIPQPQFDMVQNTPVFSPMETMHLLDSKPLPDFTQNSYVASGYPTEVNLPGHSYPILGQAMTGPQAPAPLNSAQCSTSVYDAEGQLSHGLPTEPSECCSFRPMEYPTGSIHGLPTSYMPSQPTTAENAQPVILAYSGTNSDHDYRTAPAGVAQGFRGNKNALGKSQA